MQKTCKDLTQPIFYLTFNDSSKSSFLKKNILNFRDYDYDQNNYLDTVNCQIKLNEEEIKAGEKILDQVELMPMIKLYVCLLETICI